MTDMSNEFEQLYEDCHEAGGMSSYAYEDDPKRLAFTLARYKHTAKLLEGYGHVLEVGCADGFGSRIVRQHVEQLTAIDLDAQSIEEAKGRPTEKWPIIFSKVDLLDPFGCPYPQGTFAAAYCLDVLEHIPLGGHEEKFLGRLRWVTRRGGPVVIGTPSLESQQYASKLSKEGHVNCKTGPELKKTLRKFWDHVFLFSLNDETLGTGFMPMSQYRLALCV